MELSKVKNLEEAHGLLAGTFVVGKRFTARHARYNLGLRVGNRTNRYDAHHTLPKKFDSWFNRRHLNIHNPKYLRWWCKPSHRAHATEYNRRWARFKNHHPRASRKEVLKFRANLSRKYRGEYKCRG